MLFKWYSQESLEIVTLAICFLLPWWFLRYCFLVSFEQQQAPTSNLSRLAFAWFCFDLTFAFLTFVGEPPRSLPAILRQSFVCLRSSANFNRHWLTFDSWTFDFHSFQRAVEKWGEDTRLVVRERRFPKCKRVDFLKTLRCWFPKCKRVDITKYFFWFQSSYILFCGSWKMRSARLS